jgi:hypothetical protein
MARPATTIPKPRPAIGRHRRSAPARTLVPAGRAISSVLIALLIASLLCAESLERVAQRQPFGRTRDIALAITKPLNSVSHALFLDRPRQWVESLAGHEEQPVANVLLPTATTAPAATTAPTVPGAPPIASPPTTPPPPPEPVRPIPTADAPLRVLMAGDSLIGNVSQALGRFIGDEPRVHLRTDLQVGTGLSRPDVLDWGAELSTVLAAEDPNVVILSFGANDDQPLRDPQGNFFSLFTEGWASEYARRVGAIMDLASDGGRRTVVWIGLAPERPERLNQAKDTFNAAARDQAAARPNVHYVDLVAQFGGPGGTYSDTVTLPDGSIVNARDRDGVHLSHAGADLLAPVLWQTFAPEWHLTG